MTTFKRDQSAQAILEMAFILPILCVMLLGVVDYSRAIYDEEVITNLAGEGAGLASRSTSLPNAVTAVVGDSDLNLTANGCVIVTSVSSPSAGKYQVTRQAQSSPCNGGTSQVGCFPPPSSCGTATVPAGVRTLFASAPSGYTVYITEVYYNFTPVTGIGSFLGSNGMLPSRMYAVAYY